MVKEINRFIEYLKEEKGKSENTLISYRRDIVNLQTYLLQNDYESFYDVNKTTIMSYILDLENKGKSASTISRHIASIRSFYSFLQSEQKVTINPCNGIKTIKIEKKETEYLTETEIEKLLNSIIRRGKDKELRDRAMIELLYVTGMKVSELVSLKFKDINLNENYVICNNLKGQRAIPIDDEVKKSLKNYLKVRKGSKDKEDYIFTNAQNESISRQGFWRILTLYGQNAKMRLQVTPNVIKNSYVMNICKKDK